MIVKEEARQRRHKRLRKKIDGRVERPRICIYKSLNHIYAQLIDDTKGHTLITASTLDKELKNTEGHKGNTAMARRVGLLIASRAVSLGVKKVVFDRGGYKYHGRIKALADGAREGGLEF